MMIGMRSYIYKYIYDKGTLKCTAVKVPGADDEARGSMIQVDPLSEEAPEKEDDRGSADGEMNDQGPALKESRAEQARVRAEPQPGPSHTDDKGDYYRRVEEFFQILIGEHLEDEAEETDGRQSRNGDNDFQVDEGSPLLREIERERNRRGAFKEARMTPLQEAARERMEKALDEALKTKRWGTSESILSETVAKRRANF